MRRVTDYLALLAEVVDMRLRQRPMGITFRKSIAFKTRSDMRPGAARRATCLYRLIALLAIAVASAASATPFVPATDAQVLETLPYTAGDPAMRELRALQQTLRTEPNNLPVAVRLARGYLERGRATSDPRYAGYAQAVLQPWWDEPHPPRDVLMLRATMLQRVHRFDAALADLAALLASDPRNVQARLTRATVLQVVGNFDAANADCQALRGLTTELVWTACADTLGAATGKLDESYAHLRETLNRFPDAPPALRSWALTSLAEMAERAEQASEADTFFRAALALDPTDAYPLAAFADFLLDSGRGAEAEQLMQPHTRADPLLLRYALALQARQASDFPKWRDQLRDRFEASHLRGDRVHLREEARFTLHVLHDASAALPLARDNWLVQKEPADLRILVESAVAAGSELDIESARAWLRKSGLEDKQLLRALDAPGQHAGEVKK